MDAVETNRGAFVTVPAWHGKGKTVELRPGLRMEELAREGRMFYTVSKVPSQVSVMDADGMHTVDVKNQFHLVRSDDNRVLDRSTVTERYGIIQPETICRNLDVYVDAGFAVPDAAFSLYEGNSDVFQILMHGVEGPLGEEWQLYFTVQNFHGGKGPCRGKVGGLRVVCHNTATIAFGAKGQGADWRVRHGSQAEYNVDIAMREWALAKEAIERFNASAEKLACTKVDIPDTVDRLLGIIGADKVTTQLSNKRDDLIARADMPSKGTIGESLWDIYNAVTNYNAENDSGRGAQTAGDRFASSINGARNKFEVDAWDKLLAMV